MRVKTVRLPDFDGVELKEAAFRGQVFPTHFHETFSVSIVESGLEKLTTESRELFVPAGSIVLLNPLQSHASSCFGDATLRYKSLYISPDGLRFLQRQQPARQPGLPWIESVVIENPTLFSLIQHLHATAEPGNAPQFTRCFQHLLAHYAGAKPSSETRPNGHEATLDEIKERLKGGGTGKITVEKLAAEFKISKFRLIRDFKHSTGLTPIAYLILHRIEQAKRMLRTDLSLTEIALETDFYDQSHFIHCFRKYVGVVPSAYRKGLDSWE